MHALADDYLRVIARTRPWTRRAEAEALAAFAEWAAGDPERLRLESPDGAAALAARCAAELGLAPELRERMATALRGFAAWAAAEAGLAGTPSPAGAAGP
jgi:hypothetical protein